MLLSAQAEGARSAWAWRLSLAWLGFMLVLAVFGGWIIEGFGLPAADHLDRACMGGCAPLTGQSLLHVLGTDSLGRDVLSQLIGGARTAILGGVAASGLSFILGYSLGSWAAWFSRGGRRLSWWVLAEAGIVLVMINYFMRYSLIAIVPILITLIFGIVLIAVTLKRSKSNNSGIQLDRLLLYIAEVFSSVPALLLLLALAAMAFRPGLFQLVLIYVFVRWTRFAVLALQEVRGAISSPYVQAAYHAGIPELKLLWNHILPNTIGTLWVQMLLGVSAFIIIEGTFSFLGLGLPAEQASWGRILSEARSVSGGWWLWVIPGIVLSATILSLQTLGRSTVLRRMSER